MRKAFSWYVLFIVLIGSLLFGVCVRSGMRRAFARVDWGAFYPDSLYHSVGNDRSDYFNRYRYQAVGSFGLYQPGYCSVYYNEVNDENYRVDTLKAGVRVAQGGWADFVFRRVGGNYYCFRLSRDPEIYSGFYIYSQDQSNGPTAHLSNAFIQFQTKTVNFDPDYFDQVERVAWEQMADALNDDTESSFSYFNVEIRMNGSSFEARVNNRKVCAMTDTTYHVGSVGVQAGRFPGIFIRRIAVSGTQLNGLPFDIEHPFDGFMGGSRTQLVWASLLGIPLGLLVISVLSGLLVWVTGCRIDRALILEAGGLLVIGLPIYGLKGVGSIPLYTVVVTSLWLGLHAIALVVAKGPRIFRMDRHGDAVGWGIKQALFSFKNVALLLLFIGLTIPGVLAAVRTTHHLDSDSYADQTITGTVTLEEDSVIEIYFHKEEPQIRYGTQRFRFPAQWVALRLSSDPENPSRFVSSIGPERQRPQGRILEPDTDYAVQLEVSGSRAVAFLDGEALDVFSDDALPGGLSGYSVQRGAGEVQNFLVRPTDPTGLLTVGVLKAGLMGLALSVLVGAVLTRLGRFDPDQTYWRVAFCLLPFPLASLGILLTGTDRPNQWFAAAWVVYALLLLSLFLRNAGRIRLAFPIGLALIALVMATVFHLATRSRAAQIERLAARPPGYLTGSERFPDQGRHDPEMVWAHYAQQIPFRGQLGVVAPDKQEKLHRILVLGGASAYGLGVLPVESYAHTTAGLLPDRSNIEIGINGFEVLNAARPHSDATQAVRLLKYDLLKQYQPDIVVLHVGYHDVLPERPPVIPETNPLAALFAVPFRMHSLTVPRGDPTEAVSDAELATEPSGESAPTPLEPSAEFHRFERTLQELLLLQEEQPFKLILIPEAFDTWSLKNDKRSFYFNAMEQLANENADIAFLDIQSRFQQNRFNSSFSTHTLYTESAHYKIAEQTVSIIRHWPR